MGQRPGVVDHLAPDSDFLATCQSRSLTRPSAARASFPMAPLWPLVPLLLFAVFLPCTCFWFGSRRPPPPLPPLPGTDLLLRSTKPFTILTPPSPSCSTGLLFVPGAGGTAAMFCEQAAALCTSPDSPRAAFVEHAGHGGRATLRWAPDDLDPAMLTANVAHAAAALLAAWPPHQRARVRLVVVAHSYGSALVARALRDAALPQVAAVVLLAPPVLRGVGLVRAMLLRVPPVVLDALRALDRLPGRRGGRSRSVRRMLGGSASEALARRQLDWNRGVLSAVVQALGLRAEVCEPHAYADAFRRSGVRVDVVVGERDGVCAPSGAFAIWDAVKTSCPATMRLVEGEVGHQVMLEVPAVVNEVIETAVRDVSANAGA